PGPVLYPGQSPRILVDPKATGSGGVAPVLLTLVRQIQAVHRVVGYIVDCHVDEPGVGQHRTRQLLTPDRAQSRPAVRERDGHAVQGAGGVQHWGERISDVAFQVTGRLDVEHDEHAAGRERRVHPVQHTYRVYLIVNRV